MNKLGTYTAYESLNGSELNLLVEDDVIAFSAYQDHLSKAIKKAKESLEKDIYVDIKNFNQSFTNKKYTVTFCEFNPVTNLQGSFLRLKVSGTWIANGVF